MRSLILLPLVATGSLAIGCSQAQLSVQARSTDSLALSAQEATEEEEGGAGETQLLLHVLRTEAHVSGSGAEDEGEGDADADADDDGDAEDAEDDGGWTVVSDAARDVDLVALSGAPDEIADGPVPVGRLTQLRLVLDPERPATLVRGDVETELSVPSGATSGLKLRSAPPMQLTADAPVSVTVQIDGVVEMAEGKLTVSPVLELLVDG